MNSRDVWRSLWFAILALAMGLLLAVVYQTCNLPTAQAAPNFGAVTWLLQRDGTPRADPRWADAYRIEKALIGAAMDHNIDPALMVAMGYKESSFELDAKGKIGEIGLVQVHGKAARNCDLQTPEGQAECGAKWLSRVTEECGGRIANNPQKCIETGARKYCSGGLAAYASGSCSATETVSWIVRGRLKLAERIRPYLIAGDTAFASGGF